MAVIGIDFGTEFSSVTVINKLGKLETIPDDQGKVRVSSCVSFHEDEIRVGNLADLKREVNVSNTIYDIKMLIGISLEKGIQLKSRYDWPFDLSDDGQGRMQVQVHYLKSLHKFYPEEIVSILFRHLIEIAEKRLLQRKVRAAVITVATSFNHSQRKAIIDAAHIANLEVKALLNDTTAAAVYHAFMHRNHQSGSQLTSVGERIMVINIGAGTFSVSICDINKNSNVSVICSNGASSVGGRDINKELFALLKKSYKTNVGLNRSLDQAKKDFSSSQRRYATIDISIGGKMPRQEKIMRKTYEEACKSLKRKLETAIKETLYCPSNQNYGVRKVILAGGSTRLPLVNKLLQSFNLLGKIEKTYVKTDEIVALGACITAYEISIGKKLENIIGEKLSYGVYNDSARMLVTKNSTLPANHDIGASITKELIEILDKEENTMLFAKVHQCSVPIRCFLCIDQNGLISISSDDMKAVTDGLHKDKIEELKTKQIQLRKSDAERKVAGEERYGLERAALHIKKRCIAIVKWLEDNQNSNISDVRLKMQELGSGLQHISENQNLTFTNKSAIHVEHVPCCDSWKQLQAEHSQNKNFQEEITKLKRNLKALEIKKSELESAIQNGEKEVKRVQEDSERRMTVQEIKIKDWEKQCSVWKEKFQRAHDENEKNKQQGDSALKELEEAKRDNTELKLILQKSKEDIIRVQEDSERRMTTVRHNTVKELEKQASRALKKLEEARGENAELKLRLQNGEMEEKRVQEDSKRRMTVQDIKIKDWEKQCNVWKEKFQRAHDENEEHKQLGGKALKDLKKAQRENKELSLRLQKSKEAEKRVREDLTHRIIFRENTIKDLEKWCSFSDKRWQREYDADEELKEQLRTELEKTQLELKRIKEKNLELQDQNLSLQLQSTKIKQKTVSNGSQPHLSNATRHAPSSLHNKKRSIYRRELYSATKPIDRSKVTNSTTHQRSFAPAKSAVRTNTTNKANRTRTPGGTSPTTRNRNSLSRDPRKPRKG